MALSLNIWDANAVKALVEVQHRKLIALGIETNITVCTYVDLPRDELVIKAKLGLGPELEVRGRFETIREAASALLEKLEEEIPKLLGPALQERAHRRILDV